MKKIFSLMLLVIASSMFFQVQAFTPLYPSGNFIADPQFNAATLVAGGYAGWGTTSIITTGYEGTGASIAASCGGSLNRDLTAANGALLKPLTKYRVKLMAKNTGNNAGGVASIQIEGVSGGGSNVYSIPQSTNYIPVDYSFFTGTTITINKGIYLNSCNGTRSNGALLVDNYEMYAVPGITASVNALSFDANTLSQSFIVSVNGSLAANVSLVPPTGITLTSNSIITTQGSTITATWDGTTVVSGNIQLTDGTLNLSLPVTAVTTVTTSYAPLYPNKNYIKDPEFNSSTIALGGYSGWGTTSISNDPTIVYSGTRCGAVLPNYAGNINTGTGSLDRAFTAANGNPLKTLTNYVIKAKVWAVDGPFMIGVKNYNGGNETTQAIPQTASWTDYNQNFTTGTTIGGDPRIYFGNYGLYASTGYIDNWEVREVPGLTASAANVTLVSTGVATSTFVLYVSGASSLLTATHVPAGITIAPVALDTIKGNTITVTWDKVASISDNLTFSCGNYTLNIPVVATRITNALLNISLSTGALNPVFNPATTTYSVVLPGGTTSVTPTVVNDGTLQTVTGTGAVDVTSGSGISTIVVNPNDGTAINTYTINYTVSSVNYAISLPGGADANISNVALPALNITSLPTTIEMWYKPDAVQGNYATLLYCRGLTINTGIQYDKNTDATKIKGVWNNVAAALPTAKPIAGQWNHVALVVTSTTKTLYINGVAQIETGTYTNFAFDAITYLGNDVAAAGRTIKGLIDEVRIWNVERTAQQLQDNKGVTLTGKEAGLVGYWDFDDQQSTLSTDVTGAGHNGINHGATYVASFDKTDATLSALTLSAGSLGQTFGSATTTYNATYPAGTSTVTVAGTAASALFGATVSGDGIIDVSGVNPTATVVVTAPNRTATKTYTLNFSVALSTGNVSNYSKNLFASVLGKQVLVNGTKAGDVLKVYNTSGLQVAIVNATSDKTILDLNKGVYLIKINSSVLKVVL